MNLREIIYSIPRDLRSAPRAVKRAAAVISLYYFGWALLDPFLPIYFTELFGGYSLSTLAISLLYLFSALWSIPMGRLADILSKKKLISLFLFFYLPLIPILGFVRTIFQITVFRFFHSFLASGLWATSETYIRAHSERRHRAEAIGIFDASYTLVIVVGAVLGGFFVAKFGIKPLFWVAPFAVLAAVLFSKYSLPDHSGSENWSDGLPVLKPGVFSDGISDFLRHKKLVLLTGLSFLYGLPMFASSSVLLPLFSDALGASPVQIGLVYALALLPFVFEAPFSVLSDHLSNKKILMLAGTFAALVFVFLFFAKSVYWLFPLAFLVGLSFAVMIPTIEGRATALMPKDHIGKLNGVYRAVNHLGYGLGILVVGPFADMFGINSPFLLASALMLLFVFFVAFLWKKVE